jgi:hypothetical protein
MKHLVHQTTHIKWKYLKKQMMKVLIVYVMASILCLVCNVMISRLMQSNYNTICVSSSGNFWKLRFLCDW